jgi:hypothetical protein
MLGDLRAVVREWGWTLAVHGSNRRDLDLIAVPWRREAAGAGVIVAEVATAVEATIHDISPVWKPHGRLGYAILVRSPAIPWPYIDLSIVDPREALGPKGLA